VVKGGIFISLVWKAGAKTTTWFLIRNEYKISHIKRFQRTTPDGLDALAST
jgi:hypothetical protein